MSLKKEMVTGLWPAFPTPTTPAGEVDEKRLEKARGSIRKAASGIRARSFQATPDYISCGYCAFRDICPASAAK